MTDERGQAVPIQLPADTVRTVAAGTIKVMLAPGAPGMVDLGLLIELPPPIGVVRISLSQAQAWDLHEKLAGLVALNPEQVVEMVERFHNNNDSNGVNE